MTEQTTDFSSFISSLKRRRLGISMIFATIFLIGILAALLWPPTYESSATILIKEQDIPTDLVRTTVTTFASQRIQAISQRVMARPKLLEIIEKYTLYEDEKKRLTSEEIIFRMRQNIELETIDANVVDPRSGRPMAATIAFRLAFTGKNAATVQKVANELMTLYLKENLRERTEQAGETSAFLNEEALRLSNKIHILEEAFINFKKEHGDSLPELNELNEQMLTRADDGLANINSRIALLQEGQIYIKNKLAQTNPYGSDDVADPANRLQALQTTYTSFLARYSADHPDVLRVKREIQSLEQQLGIDGTDNLSQQQEQLEMLRTELASLRKQYSDEHPDVINAKRQVAALESSLAEQKPKKKKGNAGKTAPAPTNPEYIDLVTQLRGADVKMEGLLLEKARVEEKLAEYEKRLLKTPQIESQYRALRRDLSNAVNRYQEIHEKQMEAQIAQTLEDDSKGERFVIIEPPVLPEEPIKPNRLAIVILSFILALGSGIAYAFAAENMDSTVRGANAIKAVLGAAPLTVIPYLESNTETSARKRRLTVRVAAAVGVVVIAISLVHIFLIPLDVLWYRALRKADVILNI